MSKNINIELVKKLRDTTGVSVMQCKNALEETNGDIEKALIVLNKKSSSVAMKKSGRTATDGIITIVEESNKSLLLTLHSETDFVAKNEDFTNLANKLTKLALEKGIEEMKKESVDIINPVIQKVGEKIELGVVEELIGDVLGNYVHNGKSGVIVSLKGGDKELAKDIAMHIAAMKPVYMTEDEITEEDKEKVNEVFKKEVNELTKPEDIKKKILEGKINTYFKEQTLTDQIFIKDSNKTIGQLLKERNASLVKFIHESIN